MQTKTKLLLTCLALPLGVGALSSLLTRHDMASFSSVAKPPLYPPEHIFPIVWTILFLLMGIASYRVLHTYRTRSIAAYRIRIAIAYYALSLTVTFLWPFVFFHYRAYYIALVLLCALFYTNLRTYHSFSSIDSPAGSLLLPLLVWIAFAGYLDLAIALMN